jgi:hypothetical protein
MVNFAGFYDGIGLLGVVFVVLACGDGAKK